MRSVSVELVSEGLGWEERRRETLERVDERRTEIAMRMRGRVKVRFVKRGFESFPLREGKVGVGVKNSS